MQEYVATISKPLKTKMLANTVSKATGCAVGSYEVVCQVGERRLSSSSGAARELVSLPLQTWFTEHGVALTTAIGEEPAANGRAEVEIQIIKSQVRRMLKAGSIPVKFWPAVRKLGVPKPALLACGTVVRAKPRSWVNRSNPWRNKMVEGKILSVAPNCAHGYAVLLPNESILLSSTVVAAPVSLVPKPLAGWEKKQPTCRVQGKSRLRWIVAESLGAAKLGCHLGGSQHVKLKRIRRRKAWGLRLGCKG